MLQTFSGTIGQRVVDQSAAGWHLDSKTKSSEGQYLAYSAHQVMVQVET